MAAAAAAARNFILGPHFSSKFGEHSLCHSVRPRNRRVIGDHRSRTESYHRLLTDGETPTSPGNELTFRHYSIVPLPTFCSTPLSDTPVTARTRHPNLAAVAVSQPPVKVGTPRMCVCNVTIHTTSVPVTSNYCTSFPFPCLGRTCLVQS